MDISIIICTYNRCLTLGNVLEDIQNLHGSPEILWETLVIDNNSTDETKAVVESFARQGRGNVRYIFEERQGKSYALNTGIGAARGEIVAFTDDDVSIDPDWLLNIKKTFDQCACAGIGGKIIPVIPGEKPSWLRMDAPTPFMNVLGCFDYGDECRELRSPPFGANMAFRKQVLMTHGLFRLDLGPTMGNLMGKGEDSEISLRLISRGEKLMYVPDAVVFHRIQKEKVSRKSFQSYYFNYGRFRAKIGREEFSNTRIVYFGVPRYMFRILIRKALDWLLTFDSDHRFSNKLEYYEFFGRIAEYFSVRKDFRPNPAN